MLGSKQIPKIFHCVQSIYDFRFRRGESVKRVCFSDARFVCVVENNLCGSRSFWWKVVIKQRLARSEARWWKRIKTRVCAFPARVTLQRFSLSLGEISNFLCNFHTDAEQCAFCCWILAFKKHKEVIKLFELNWSSFNTELYSNYELK